jgi:hypothetical protein
VPGAWGSASQGKKGSRKLRMIFLKYIAQEKTRKSPKEWFANAG